MIGGAAVIIAPAGIIRRDRAPLPEVKLMEMEKGRHLRQVIESAQGHNPIRTAVVHPVDAFSLRAAIEATKAHLISPILVGPEGRIRAAAEEAHLDLSPYDIVSTEHSHAAAAQAVAMALEHKVDALVRGGLSLEELMEFVDMAQGLRSERSMSHVFAVDVPILPRPVFVTDALLNRMPTLAEKRDIIQNAIGLLHALGVAVPKVAILASQEDVTPKLPSTLDAAVLCKMAERGQITGAILDGPLAFDTAFSKEAAKAKGVLSPVAGQADIFLVPDVEAGSILVKQLEYLANAQVADIVLGGRVPVIPGTRTGDMPAYLCSCALAVAVVAHRQPALRQTKAV